MMGKSTKALCDKLIEDFSNKALSMSRPDYEEAVDYIGSHFDSLSDCIKDENEGNEDAE